MHPNPLSREVIGAALRVHTALGPGLLESAYEACLAYELRQMGFRVECQVPLPIVYHDVKLEAGYRLDVLVEGILILEIKSLATVLPVHYAQLLSYLRLSGKPLGLLINFNVVHLRDGIKRIVNQLDSPLRTSRSLR
jgi:GxxExxY protein